MAANTAAFFGLSWRERWHFAQAVVLLPLTAAALRFVPLRRWRGVIDRPRPRRRPHDKARADRIAHMVAAAAAYGPYRASCLPQSLVLQWLLRRDGMRGELRFGVRRIGGDLTAHCWIELDGEPLIDSGEVRRHFAVLYHARACPPKS